MPGGRSTHVWSLSPPWRESNRWLSDSCDSNIWLTLLSEFYTIKIKAQSEHSVWFGFLGTWFHCRVKLNSVAVTDLSLAAWKTKSHKSLNRNRTNQTFLLLDWLLLFIRERSLQLIFVHSRHVQYWKQITQFAISRLLACLQIKDTIKE